jgi:hypothetical protein
MPLYYSPFLNLFFWDEAAAWLPKMKEDVCLSAPVDFEMEPEFAKTIVHSPHSPMVVEMKNTIEASAPIFLVFHAKNAEKFAAIVRGVRSGWDDGALSSEDTGGLGEGTLRTRVRARAARTMPK